MITIMIFIFGKLYPNGVDFYEKYEWDLEDFIGPNFVMVNRCREDLYDLLRTLKLI